MASPYVAIIVPIYNVDLYIEECLNSIRNQTFKNFKVFLVNDGSTDGSKVFANNFVNIDKRFILIDQGNSGVGAARNAGLMLAEKENFDYISFVDPDDVISLNFLEKLVDVSERESVDVTLCSYYLFDSSNGVINKKKQELPEFSRKMMDVKEYVEFIYGQGRWRKVFGAGGMVCRGLFSAKKVKGLRFSEERSLIEDELYSLIVASRVNFVQFISDKLYGYRQRDGSLVHSDCFLRRLFDGRIKAVPIAKSISKYAYTVVSVSCVDVGIDILKKGGNLGREEIIEFRSEVEKFSMIFNISKLKKDFILLCDHPYIFRCLLIGKKIRRLLTRLVKFTFS